MIKARLFDQFDGARTLLVWGDADGMRAMKEGLSRLLGGDRQAGLGDVGDGLTVGVIDHSSGKSRVRSEDGLLRWECSIDILGLAANLIEPLLLTTGHQFLDATDQAEQVIISVNEYPADLR